MSGWRTRIKSSLCALKTVVPFMVVSIKYILLEGQFYAIYYTLVQGCKFSDFCLISENFTSKYMKMFFEISSFRWFYDKFRFSDKVSVSFQIFSVNFTYIPVSVIRLLYIVIRSLMERRYREWDNQSCITLECDMTFQPIRTQESGHMIKVNNIDQFCVF